MTNDMLWARAEQTKPKQAANCNECVHRRHCEKLCGRAFVITSDATKGKSVSQLKSK